MALMGGHIEFTGNPLAYIMNLSQVNSELGEKVMKAYRVLKNN